MAGERVGGVVELRDFSLCVGDVEAYRIVQAVFQAVVPGQGKFPTVSLQVGSVLQRLGHTQDVGKEFTCAQHAGSLTLVVVEGTGQAAVQDGEVKTQVPLRHLFPRNGVAHQGARSDDAHLLAAEQIAARACAVSRQVSIPATGTASKCLVCLATVRSSDLQIVEEAVGGFTEPFFFRKSPTQRERGVEHGAVVLREFGREVVTSVQFHQVAVVERIVDTGESASGCPAVVGVTYVAFAGSIVHRGQVVVNQVVALCIERANMLGLLVVTYHHLEVVLAQRLFVVAHQVEGIVRIVVLVFIHVVRVRVLEFLQVNAVGTIFREALHVVLVVLGIVVEGVVHLHAQSFQRLDFDGCRIPEVVLRGSAVTAIFQHGCEVGVVALSRPVSVRVSYRHQRLRIVTNPCIAVYLILLDAGLLGADEAGLHRDGQPVIDIVADVVHYVELAEAFIAVAQDRALVHVAHRGVVRSLVATAAQVDVILLQRIALLVDFVHPVRVAAISPLACLAVTVLPAVGVGSNEHGQIVHRVVVVSLDMVHFFLAEDVTAVGIHIGRVHPRSILHGVHVAGTCSRAVERYGCVERYAGGLVLLTALGRNQYHTIGGAGTVDRCRSGILQYRYARYILRVDKVRVHFHTVYQYQR